MWSMRILAMCLLGLAMCGRAQDLTGRWAAVNDVKLDDGESQPWVMELTQTGNTLKGKLDRLAGPLNVFGTVNGSHFELAWSTRRKPFMTGELVDGKLVGTQWGSPFTAHPATPADELPRVEALPLPALHNVPYNGLAKTPPMGWNSWNHFQGRVTDEVVRQMADAMVSSGMRDAGYVYVNIDDTWEGLRDAQGNLQSNHKFPDMKALADYLHSKGLKLGIYSSPGPRTCAGYPGSYGHEVQDGRTFAEWGVDYLKYDYCSASSVYGNDAKQALYQKMGDALLAAGRPIVYSLSGGGSSESADGTKLKIWGPSVDGNLWRTSGDIMGSWTSMMRNIHDNVKFASTAGPGHWNDPDMLEVGNGLTDDEARTHMSLWALSAAPLIAGNDLRTMSDATKAILTNREVIAVDQDPLGKQAVPVTEGDLETWIKPLADGSVAVGVVNTGAAPAQATVTAAELGLNDNVRSARDLWSHRAVRFTNGKYTATIPSHGVLMLRVSAKSIRE